MHRLGRSYTVRAVHCDHRAADEEVYQALERATASLPRAWEKLARAGRIAVKFNQDWPLSTVVTHAGQRQQLVSDSVARATLRLLRERTGAEIVCVDASYHVMYGVSKSVEETTTLASVLREFDVELVDGTQPPYKVVAVPSTKGGAGGQMFETYTMMEAAVEADALVSVAKMKNHAYMGVTGCLKNLFGLMPGAPHARPRHYYHHLVRMPYMLADIGRIFDPALNIVDALLGQAEMEWGDGVGTARVVNGLVAGDHVIATDACMAHLMGHNPAADWLTAPFHRDRNPLVVSVEGGFGTVDLDAIDYTSELVPQPSGTFYAKEWDSGDTVVTWRRTMAEQGLYYRDHMEELLDYAGEYILLQDGEVRWHAADGIMRSSRRKLAGPHKNHAMFLKYVDPEEREQEHFEVYEQVLEHIKTLELSKS
jgi:uncharacterized protein (DUF362 family)